MPNTTGRRICFAPDEDRFITELRIAGASLRQIALKSGRWKSSIQIRLDWLAARDEAEDDAKETPRVS
jgi:hypothetical protein